VYAEAFQGTTMNTLKIAIWTLALVGMAPAILLAVLNLSSTIALTRHLKGKDNAGLEAGDFTTFQSYMEFGKGYHIELTSSLWPSVTLLVGAGTFAAGLLYLIPPQNQVRRVGEFEEIELYVEKVVNSPSPHAYVVISLSEDAYTAVTVSKSDDHLAIEFFMTKKEQVGPVLAFFSKQGLEPDTDNLTEEGTEFETRSLSFPVAGSTERISQICRTVMVDAYQIGTDAELVFTLGK
jgi:hypothetical protein